MDKTAKNVLATVGAITVATAAPMLAAGVAIGVVASNPEKAKKTVENLVGRAEDMFAKANAHHEGNECECCHGGKCDCEEECCCDCDDEFEEDEVHIPCEELEPESWEEDVPVAEEESPAEETAEEPAPAEKAVENNFRREKLERLFQVLLDLVE